MKSNKYLTIGLLTGFIVGGCIGVLAWAFLQNLFAISICAGIGMLIGNGHYRNGRNRDKSVPL